MTYTIIDTDTDSDESVHPTLALAAAHMDDQCRITEYIGGQDVVRYTTFGLHHRIRNDATGAWIEHE